MTLLFAAVGAIVVALLESTVIEYVRIGGAQPHLVFVLAIIVTVVGTFTHHTAGADAVWRLLRGVAASLFGFVAFFLIVGLTLSTLGLALAYGLATLATLAVTAALLVAHRRRHAREARSAEAVRQPS